MIEILYNQASNSCYKLREKELQFRLLLTPRLYQVSVLNLCLWKLNIWCVEHVQTKSEKELPVDDVMLCNCHGNRVCSSSASILNTSECTKLGAANWAKSILGNNSVPNFCISWFKYSSSTCCWDTKVKRLKLRTISSITENSRLFSVC